MAQNQVMLVDDIDGGDAEESVSFGLDGVKYEIDLSEANAAALREALAPWVGHARRVAGRSRSGARRGGVRPRAQPRPRSISPRCAPGPGTTATRSATAAGSQPR